MSENQAVEAVNWHALNVEQVLDQLKTDVDEGLHSGEAANRMERYGTNVLEEVHQRPWYRVFLHQFVDVLILILFIATIIAFLLGEVGDALTILAIVVMNGVLGFIQEWRAEKAIDALKKMLSPQCKVIRDGQAQTIDASELVPGDVVVLEIGDRVPADLRIVEALNVKVDEAILTGESISVAKQVASVSSDAILSARSSIAWMGTAVTNGCAKGIVVATGMFTEFGRIAHLTQTVQQEVTPLQRKLTVLGKQLGLFAIAISIVIGIAGFIAGKPLLEMFFTAISLAVAVVPEGLPIVVTITMALGIRAMAKRRALLRRLQAAETLGAASVICTDKTGTLTQNEMTVTRVWLPTGAIDVTGVGYDPAGHFSVNYEKIDYRDHPDLLALLETGYLCNHAKLFKDDSGWHEVGEPTEAALVTASYKAWFLPAENVHAVSEFSFNSSRKRMTVIAAHEDNRIAHVKGAPEIILERCTHILVGTEVQPLTAELRQTFNTQYMQMATTGLRTLALARRVLPVDIEMKEDVVEQDLTLLGLVGIIDPPRKEVPAALRIAREAGIRTIMITGDAPETALAIAERIGMSVESAVNGAELEHLSDEALTLLLNGSVLFARAAPEDKLRIVRLLQEQRHVVGMTGDGVNDAPALKKADIGIAMGIRGTDVAKSASDMILTDDNFASIISAVKEGRRQYANIQRFVRYLLSSNMGEVIAIFFNILIGGPLILLPVQILWMNLVTDGMTSMALGVEPAEKGIMREQPRSPKEPILGRKGIAMIFLLGGYIGLMTLLLFQYYLRSADPTQKMVAQTMAFTGIIVLEKMNVFNFRSFKQPLFKIGFFSNPWVLITVLITLGLQVCAVYVPFLQHMLHTVPLSLKDWGIMLMVAAPILIGMELYKTFTLRSVGQRSRGL